MNIERKSVEAFVLAFIRSGQPQLALYPPPGGTKLVT